MQEEVENRTVAITTSAAKFTGRLFKAAICKYLEHRKNVKTQKANKVRASPVVPHGKQTVKQLIGQNQGVEQTALADRQEVKAFERYARQYGVDYAIHKGTSDSGKTRYLVFFKARDRAAIDQAMRAYAMDFLAKRKAQRNVPPQLDTASPSKQKERSRQKGQER